MDKDMEKNLSCRNVLSVELVAAYVRVSTQEQKLHGLSLDAQKMKLTEYAEKNGMKIVEWYVDEGVSARKLIRNRPELQRMIQDAEKGKFERIIFIKLDRFFRSVAEYHECMKRLQEDGTLGITAQTGGYTACAFWFPHEAYSGNVMDKSMTIAELEADMAGERINIVNEYKVQTGQPLSGSQPFGFMIDRDETTGRKKIIRDPDDEEALRDVIQYYMTHQSVKKALVYLHAKYHVSMGYKSLKLLLSNTMLYGAYRDNPSYCEAYIDKDTFDKIQEIMRCNVKENTAKNRAYLFSGLVLCPHCGNRLSGNTTSELKHGVRYYFKKYRCSGHRINNKCDFKKAVSEKVLERMMLANIEKYLEDAKIRAFNVEDSDEKKIPQYDIEDISAQIDRLNYSWQTGKIRTVEKYEKGYAELLELLEKAEAERVEVPVKDFGKIEAILHSGWETIYNELDDAYKRAFWRSFVKSIEIDWKTKKKEIVRVNFF